MKDLSVVVYTMQGCPFCQDFKDMLQNEGIEFFDRDIDKFKQDGTKKGHMFVFYKKTEKKRIPDLTKAQDGFEHTECQYFKKDDLPKEEENEELTTLIRKILK